MMIVNVFGFFAAMFRPIFTFLFGWLGRSLPYFAVFFGSTVFQLLFSLGFGFSTFVGFNSLTGLIIDYALSGFSGLPDSVIHLLGLMWVDKALNLVLSSAIALMTLKGLKGGSLTKSVWHSPAARKGGFDA